MTPHGRASLISQDALARARTTQGDPEAAASSLRLALAAIPNSVALRLELAQLLPANPLEFGSSVLPRLDPAAPLRELFR